MRTAPCPPRDLDRPDVLRLWWMLHSTVPAWLSKDFDRAASDAQAAELRRQPEHLRAAWLEGGR